MKLNILPLALLLLLGGCSLIQLTPDPAKQREQKRFIIAFDTFVARGSYSNLLQFKQDYPDSLWAIRAASVIRCAQEIEQLEKQYSETLAAREEQARLSEELEQLKKESQQQQKETQELNEQRERLTRDNKQHGEIIERLTQQNQQLTAQIEQLKALLIELEQRPK